MVGLKRKCYKSSRIGAINSGSGSCAYITKNGNRCAVGLFIPKGHEGGSYEGNVCNLLTEHPDLEKVMPLTARALNDLQRVHDQCSRIVNGDKDRNAKQEMLEWVKKNVE